ncbi:MAG: M14 family metallopeptidase, partial [Gemmatimonadota bacterium]
MLRPARIAATAFTILLAAPSIPSIPAPADVTSAAGVVGGPLLAQQPATAVPTPESVVGFELGTDGRLADWSTLVEYYHALGEASDRVRVHDLGESTLGNPFLLVMISSPENLARADRIAEIGRRLADPRDLSEGDIERLVDEGRSVVAVTVGLHSTEVAATQMAPGLAYRLATDESPANRRVLDETVLLLFACFNPDGTEMVVDWVDETRGTQYEGAWFPDLYHHYAGHDNNRDGYALNLAESRRFAEVVYRDWIPQLYLDVHQMGSYGARLYVPPYDDPINPNVDPLVWMEHELVGANMQIALEHEGVTGVVTGSPYTGWWFPSFHMVTNHHNIAGMLTETASAKMAWPLYIHPHQLSAHGRKHQVYGPMQLFPHPWEGGWWRLSDLIHQQHVSTYATLETAANNRELLLRNMAFKARRTIERGRTQPPHAFILPTTQHDPLTVDKLVRTLMMNGIEVQRAENDFVHEGRAFRAGDYVVSTAQPNGVLVRSLLGSAHYPDDATTRRVDGTIRRPYDMANFVLAEHMGVEAAPANSPLDGGDGGALALRTLDSPPGPEGI